MLTHYVNLCYVIFLVLFKANRCLNHVVVDAQNTIDDVESQTNVVNNGDAIPDISDIDFDDLVSVEIHGDEFDKGTPGMDYLGIGYDAIKGNTMGGEESLLDPGYRAPIINFNWRKSAEGYSPSLNAVYPLYGWVRPVYSCGRSSKIQEIENLDELKKVFSANASIKGDIPAVAFSASAKYKNASEKLAHKTERMYLHTDICVRYQAGIPLNINWDTTSSFMEAMKSLEPLPDTVKKMCSAHDMIDDMTKSECIPLKKWIKFFEMFGTHYVHQLLLGGKLIQTLKINASKLQALKNDSIDVDLVVSSVLGSSSASLLADKVVNKYKLDELGAKSITVIGGNMPNTPITDAEYAIWGNSVAENPMPIGIVGDSLKNLMDKNLRDSYSLAIHKYAELNGATYETLMKLENGGRTGLMKEIKHGESIVTVNWFSNGSECPKGQKILIGFSLLFDPQGRLLGIIPCKTGSYKCTVPLEKENVRSISWAICTIGLQPTIYQVSSINKEKEENTIVSCPYGGVIHMGIKFHAKEDRLTGTSTCKNGINSCEARVEEGNIIGIWAVCSADSLRGDLITIVGSVGDKTVNSSCGKNETLIGGIKAFFNNNKPDNRRSMSIFNCDRFIENCVAECRDDCLAAMVLAFCSIAEV